MYSCKEYHYKTHVKELPEIYWSSVPSIFECLTQGFPTCSLQRNLCDCKVKYFSMFCWINEIRILLCFNLLLQLMNYFWYMIKLNSQNSSENVKTPLILLHVAHLMTRLTGVLPAVDLSWKALVYINDKSTKLKFLGWVNLLLWQPYPVLPVIKLPEI